MQVRMFRVTVRAEYQQVVEGAVRHLFEAIGQAQPSGVKYAALRVGDSLDYLVLVALEQPDVNPLDEVPAFVAFQERLAGWLSEVTEPEALQVVGSYQLF